MTGLEGPREELAGLPPVVSGRVTAIITCYNGAKWICRAVDSVLAQTYPNKEIIIVDDGSSDESAETLQRYREIPEVELVFHRRNRGIPVAKNSGIKRASGEFVAFLDQDDRWHETRLAKQVAILRDQPDVGMTHTNVVFVDPTGQQFHGRRLASLPESRQAAVEAVFWRNHVISVSPAIRRNCLLELRGFDTRFNGASDADLWLRVAGRYRIAYINEVLTQHSIHPRSYSWWRGKQQLEDRIAVIEQAVARYPFLAPLRKRRLAALHVSRAVRALESADQKYARQVAIRAVRWDPYFPKAYVALLLALGGRLGLQGIRIWRRYARSGQHQAGPSSQTGRAPNQVSTASPAATLQVDRPAESAG